MVFVKKIKKSTARFLLRKKLNRLNRVVESSSFDKIKEVGLLYNVSDELHHKAVFKFVQYLKSEGKRVVSIGFIDNKKKENFIMPQLDSLFFSKKDINWIGIPTNSDSKRFINTNFDLLIDLNIDEVFPLEYICTLSRSKFKVGKTGGYHYYSCDMQIDISKNYTLDYLITQLKYYLTQIN